MQTIPYSIEKLRTLFPQGISKEDLARHYGLTTFDVAIPQGLFNRLAEGEFDPWGHYVFDYTNDRFGTLFPLTQEGRAQAIKVGVLFDD